MGRVETLEKPLYKKQGRFRRVAHNLLLWVIAIVVVSLLLMWMGFAEAMRLIQNIAVEWLLVAVGFTFMAMLFRWLKWFIVLKQQYSFRELTDIFFVSKLIGGISPARVGEFAPLVRKQYRNKEVTALIIVDRFLETYMTLFLGAIGFAVIGFSQQWIVLSWIVVFIFISVVFTILIYKDFWSFLRSILANHRYIAKLLNLMTSLSVGMRAMKPWLLVLFLFSFFGTVADFLFVVSVFFSLGEHVSFFLVAAAWCTIGLASLVAFTPGGLGIADAPGLYLYSLYGVPNPVIGATFIVSRTLAMVMPWLYFIGFRLFYWITEVSKVH